MRLPFGAKRKVSFAEWIYNHRVGLLATVVVYLVLLISFLSYRIMIKPVPVRQIAIEFMPEQEQKIPQVEQKEEDVKQLQQIEDVQIRNRASNENSKLNSDLRDDRKSNTQQIYDEAERVQQELQKGRDAYEQGLAEISAMQKKSKANSKPEQQSSTSGKDGKRETAKQKGNVIVSYDLENRNDVFLYKPAYQCEGGGQVVVNIIVNRNGKVLSATVAAASSTSDQCILDMAVQAAKASTFNASESAPDRQKGTITYLFVSQG